MRLQHAENRTSARSFVRTSPFILVALLVACGGSDAGSDAGATSELTKLTGAITADGSSTVYPITQAMAEEFGRETGGGVRATVAFSGTGGGFKRFCAGETDISNASRPITESEKQLCAQNNVEYTEFQVAIDGLTVAVNPKNTFAQCLKVDELKKIWAPGSTVQTWRDVRPEWPAEKIKLYGAGTNSGTFDYFTEVIVGEARKSRADYTASEDDNTLVQGVEGDEFSLGYFGYAYFDQNRQRLKALGIDNGSGCVEPNTETVMGGTYAPLSRPLFIYVKKASLARPEVKEFVRFYLTHSAELVPSTGYVALPPDRYQSQITQLDSSASGN
jgi:phosphate transport system substrate-binding protein